MTKNRDKRYPVAIDDLLIEFDEMDYCPMNLSGGDPVKEAIDWRDRLRYELDLLLDEKSAIERGAVEEFAQRLKANELLMIVNAFDLSELINMTLKEYEFAEQDSEEPDKFENYDKLKSQIAFFKEETERAKLSLNKKIEEYNQLSFRFCQQSYEKYKLLSNFVEKLKEKSYVNNYCEEVIRINDIDKILEESKNDN